MLQVRHYLGASADEDWEGVKEGRRDESGPSYDDAVHVQLFMPGQQLVNLFPARRRRPKPAARAESPEWLEDGEREAREMPGLNWDQRGRRQGLRDRERGAKYCMSHEKIGQKLISSPLPRGV